jgi:hypothetical protein
MNGSSIIDKESEAILVFNEFNKKDVSRYKFPPEIAEINEEITDVAIGASNIIGYLPVLIGLTSKRLIAL